MRILLGFTLLLAALGIGVRTLIARQDEARLQALQSNLQGNLNAGSLEALLRAQLAGAHLLSNGTKQSDIHAELAFITAVLAYEFGLPLIPAVSRHAVQARRITLVPTQQKMLSAAENLLLLSNDPPAALAVAEAIVASDSAYHWLVLGHARAAVGNQAAAARSYEAAIMLAPEFRLARVACAETRLELQDPVGALEILSDRAGQSPLAALDARTAIIVARAVALAPRQVGAMAFGVAAEQAAKAVEASCAQDSPKAPAIAAKCHLWAAERARTEGRHEEALLQIRAAAKRGPSDARVAGTSAQMLAQLGFVDEAERVVLTFTSTAHAGALHLAIEWARFAVALGRGTLALMPDDLDVLSSEARLLGARGAFAEGGAPALARWLERIGGVMPTDIPDLRRFAALAYPKSANDDDDDKTTRAPIGFYVKGLQARLRGDLAAAVFALQQAAHGHGDACRALGELVASLHDGGDAIPLEIRERVARVNSRCVNLDMQSVGPPVRARKRKPKSG